LNKFLCQFVIARISRAMTTYESGVPGQQPDDNDDRDRNANQIKQAGAHITLLSHATSSTMAHPGLGSQSTIRA
jgi:hypothetical protein